MDMLSNLESESCFTFSGLLCHVKTTITIKHKCHSLAGEDPNNTRLKNELTRLRLSKKPGASVSREIFEKLLDDHHRDEHNVNLDIFSKSVKSCIEAGYLLGHRDRDFGSKFATLVKSKLPHIYSLQNNSIYLICLGFISVVAKTALYILDFVKDVMFILLFDERRLMAKRFEILPQFFVVLTSLYQPSGLT